MHAGSWACPRERGEVDETELHRSRSASRTHLLRLSTKARIESDDTSARSSDAGRSSQDPVLSPHQHRADVERALA